MKILDSGNRRQFDSGAVRDIAEGKGRCDLMPLEAIAGILHRTHITTARVLSLIDDYIHSGDLEYLRIALSHYCSLVGQDILSVILDVSIHYEQGCEKYGERNWEKGIPLHCYIDSAVRHLLKYARGDDDEPHGRAFVWNILGAMWTHTHLPDMRDLPFMEEIE